MSMKVWRITMYCLCLYLLASCSDGKPQTSAYPFQIPANLVGEVPQPDHNTATEEGVALGKKLFYDPRLSANNQVSCATCHMPTRVFTDGQALSHAGVSGKPLKRHVPQLMNLAWGNGFFWDGGAKNLESVVFGPITHPDEMGANLRLLTTELQKDAHYPLLFEQAFGTDSIYAALIGRALAQYMRTLISADSPYDQFVRGEEGASLSPQALEGMRLFEAKCAGCHQFEPAKSDFFTDHAYHNIGLDSIFSEADERLMMGRFRIDFDSTLIGAYKTPSLRNIALTAPYMHDGRFSTLEEVLDHYSEGIKPTKYLDHSLKNTSGALGISMSRQEKSAIISFLHSLTDTAFVASP